MNCSQLQYLCGIGGRVMVNLVSENQVRGTLLSVSFEGVKVQTDIGSVRDLRNEEIKDILSEDIENGYNTAEIQQETRRIRAAVNLLVNSNPMGFKEGFNHFIGRAIGELERINTGEAAGLMRILRDDEKIKNKNLDVETAKDCVTAAQKYLNKDRELCRCICFLMWYGAGNSSEAMAALTSDLAADGQTPGDALYCQLGIANQMVGRFDAMTVYWLGKYYRDDPKRALDENDICCSPLWLAYVDMCSDLLYFEDIPGILKQLSQDGSARGYCCAYCSLYRLFSRSGRHTLSREAVTALMTDCRLNRLTRTAEELASYLNSDRDGYCFFASEAAEKILEECKGNGITHYTGGAEEFRWGYLYDYTATKRYGFLLGYDLMTYFLPSTVISDRRKKEIKKGFDLSRYNGDRKLMEPFLFRAESSFRRGSSYMVTELC